MSYHYLDNITIADAAYQASGDCLEELFVSSWDAALNVMVKNLSSIDNNVSKDIRIENSSIELLLFDFLQELIYFKDAEQLLLRIDSLSIRNKNGVYTLSATLYGETINPDKHNLIVDVKAVTLHRFRVEQLQGGWQSTVILDV